MGGGINYCLVLHVEEDIDSHLHGRFNSKYIYQNQTFNALSGPYILDAGES